MNNGIIFAILAGISMGAWGFFHDKSINFVNPIIGATLVSFVAFLIGIIIIFFDKQITFETLKISLNYKGLFFIALVGIFAYLIDFFTLKTFQTNINISTGFTLIIVISILTGVFFGIIFSKDFLDFKQFFGIFIIIIGIYFLLG